MSRLSQMLAAEVKRREISERAVANEFGWSQQTFNAWKNGVIPRQQWHAALSRFLQINIDDLQMLIDEAGESSGSTKLPEPTLGRVTDRKDGKFHFDSVPVSRYAVKIDTRVMEPALVLGGRAWAQPGIWPQIGQDVIVHARGGAAWVGNLTGTADGTVTLKRHSAADLVVKDVQSMHVIVLSERAAASDAA